MEGKESIEFAKKQDNEEATWDQRDLNKLPMQKKKLPPLTNQTSHPYQNIELSNTELSTKELMLKTGSTLPSKFEMLTKEPNVVEIFDLTKGIYLVRKFK